MIDTTLPPEVAADMHVAEGCASMITGVRIRTLRRWRADGCGPPFRKFGTLVRYGVADLRTWIGSQPSGGGGQ